MTDELLTAFIEDSREGLERIESDTLALEVGEGRSGGDLVNRLFRTAHSIKGGAGFFGLTAIGTLAHTLENVLHLMRVGMLRFDGHACRVLLQGFDMLSSMINVPDESENQDISEILEDIKGFMPLECQASAETTLTLSATDGHHIFHVDELSLEQALEGGKYLYHVEFDVIHDVHRKNKTPYDVIKALQESGLVLDCRVDVSSVGDLEMGIANTIPMNVLYASIIDPGIIGMLLNISEEKIRELDRAMFRQKGLGGARDCSIDSGSKGEAGSGTVFREAQEGLVVEIPDQAETPQAPALHNLLLQAMRQSPHIRLDMSRTTDVDASFAQLVAATHRSCLQMKGSFGFLKPPQESVVKFLRELGLAGLLEVMHKGRISPAS